MQVTAPSASHSRPAAQTSPIQEIKRLTTVLQAAEQGVRIAPASRAEQATQDIQRIAAIVAAGQANAAADPGRSATARATQGYHAAAETSSRAEPAQLIMSA